MRFHTTIHNENGDKLFECHVFAENSGDASENIKKYLRSIGAEKLSGMTLMHSKVRCDIETDLPIINKKP